MAGEYAQQPWPQTGEKPGEWLNKGRKTGFATPGLLPPAYAKKAIKPSDSPAVLPQGTTLLTVCSLVIFCALFEFCVVFWKYSIR